MKTLTYATNGHMGGTAKVLPLPSSVLNYRSNVRTKSQVVSLHPAVHTYNHLPRACWTFTWLFCVSCFHFKSFKNTSVYGIPGLIIMDLDQIPAYPPPPGVTSNFKNPVSLAKTLVVVNVVFLSLMTIFVGLRIYTKHCIARKLGWDDCGCYSFRCSIVTCSHV